MISVTDSAKKQAIRLMEDEGDINSFIRVGVTGGGCSGLMYNLSFDNEEKEGDKAFENNGVKVVVDLKKLFISHWNYFGLFWRTKRKRSLRLQIQMQTEPVGAEKAFIIKLVLAWLDIPKTN